MSVVDDKSYLLCVSCPKLHVDGLVQDCSISIANAL